MGSSLSKWLGDNCGILYTRDGCVIMLCYNQPENPTDEFKFLTDDTKELDDWIMVGELSCLSIDPPDDSKCPTDDTKEQDDWIMFNEVPQVLYLSIDFSTGTLKVGGFSMFSLILCSDKPGCIKIGNLQYPILSMTKIGTLFLESSSPQVAIIFNIIKKVKIVPQ